MTADHRDPAHASSDRAPGARQRIPRPCEDDGDAEVTLAGACPGSDRGMVTVEIALGLPILLLCALVAAWVIHLGQAQARLTDAARATAREAARGADEQASISAGHQVSRDARITVTRSGGVVTARAEDTVVAPGPVLSALRRKLVAEATTVSEQP